MSLAFGAAAPMLTVRPTIRQRLSTLPSTPRNRRHPCLAARTRRPTFTGTTTPSSQEESTPPPPPPPPPPSTPARPRPNALVRALGLAAAGVILSTATTGGDVSPTSSALDFARPSAAHASGLVSEPLRLGPTPSPDGHGTPGHGHGHGGGEGGNNAFGGGGGGGGEGGATALRAHWELHSARCDTETFVMFSNESSHVVDLWWVDYVGTEVFYASISPGMTFLQQSFASHPWVVRDHVSHNSVLVLVATAEPLMAVVNSV